LGREVCGPIRALLLLLTGRPVALPRLSGPGVAGLHELVTPSPAALSIHPLSPALPAPRRVLLGPADVEAFVAADLGVRHATVLTSSARVFLYDRPAITTSGSYLITGTTRTGTGEVRAFSFFVKVIHAYQRSPLRFAIPAHLRPRAAALIPWQTEADLYRSDLRDRLPHGLTIPRAAAVRDLDADSAAPWLEQVPARRVIWDARRHKRCPAGDGGFTTIGVRGTIPWC
jgi:hypothetical protein